MTKRLIFLATLLHFILLPLSVHAQLSGANTKGDYGLLAGTQAPPGFYVVPLFYDYTADTLRNRDGDSLAPIELGGDVNIRAAVLGMMWVSEIKILGGTYNFAIWPGVTNNALGFPPAQIDDNTSTGLADLYIQPFTLGWKLDRADFIAGLGVFAPTGEYEVGGDNNRGLGMWSYELFGGTTVYFDEAKSWHFATLAAYETHGKKDDTNIRVGDLLTLEPPPPGPRRYRYRAPRKWPGCARCQARKNRKGRSCGGGCRPCSQSRIGAWFAGAARGAVRYRRG